jgi:hypothetical protein
LALGPLSSVAGDPDRHRGWLLCPCPYRRRCRPGAEAARVLGPWALALAAAPSTGFGNGAVPHCWHCVYPRPLKLPSHAHFHNRSGQILCRFRLALRRKQIRAADRPSGTPAVLPSRYVASVDHTGLLRRSARCSVITQHARMQQRPSQRPPPLLHVPPCALFCGSSAGQSRRKNGLSHPGREPCGCLHAGGEKRGHLAAPGRKTKWGGYREGPLASDIGSFGHRRGPPCRHTWSTRFHCIRQPASEGGAPHSNFQQRQHYWA